MEPLVRVDNLSVSYDDHLALKEVGFEILPGRIVALVGPNGAGKTSLFRTMFGRQPKMSGSVQLCGLNPFDERDSRRLWTVARWIEDTLHLYEELTVREFLEFSGRAYGVPEDLLTSRTMDVAMNLELHERMDARLQTLSLGMKRKVHIAAGFLSGRSGPRVLVMDEPTEGLDPPSRLNLGEFLRRFVNPGGLGSDRAVLISSHNLAELSSFADDILMLDNGRLVQSGTVQELLAQHQTDLHYEISLFENHAAGLVDALTETLKLDCRMNGGLSVHVECPDVGSVHRLLRYLAEHSSRFSVRELRERRTAVERLYYRTMAEGESE